MTPQTPVTEPLRSAREEQALAEVGRTEVSAATARWLIVAFLLTIVAVPALQHVHDLVRRPAEEGTRVQSGKATRVPQAYDILRTLPSPGEIAAVRDLRGALGLLPAEPEIRAYERELEERSVLRRAVLPATQLLLTAALGAGNEQAWAGRDGWLFYRPCVEYLTAAGFLAPRRAAPGPQRDRDRSGRRDPVEAILDFSAQLEARGIRLVIMPTPAKSMIHPELLAGTPRPEPLQNPSYSEFRRRLEAQGVLLYDAAAVLWRRKLASGEAQFLKTDSHWTAAAMEAAARELAVLLRQHVPLAAQAPSGLRRELRLVEHTGDLATMLRLPKSVAWFPPEAVTIHPVRTATGAPWQPAIDSEVLLLGDSFSNIYSAGTMGFGEGAGLAEQLAAELDRPVDRIAINDGGATATRRELALDRGQERDRLAGKKVVVWQFAIRELTAGDWRAIDLGAPGERSDGGVAPLAAGAGRSLVEAVVAAHAGAPAPGSVPYKDCLSALELRSIRTLSGPPVPEPALVYVMTLADGERTEAATLQPGSPVRLSLLPWAAGEENLGSLNRQELPDEHALEWSAYWGEIVR